MTLRDTITRLFRASPPETKASHVARLLQFDSGGRARWTPRDYAALARAGFLNNAIVHRSVRLVAENVAAVTFLAYEGEQERDRHPILDLLARPNPRADQASFLEAVVANLLIAGNAYIEAVTLEGAVRELYTLRPAACAWCRGRMAGRKPTNTRSAGRPCASSRTRRCRRSFTWLCFIRSTITTALRRSKPARSRWKAVL